MAGKETTDMRAVPVGVKPAYIARLLVIVNDRVRNISELNLYSREYLMIGVYARVENAD